MKKIKNPWKTLSSKNIYDNKWINITEYKIINPNGNPGIYGKVHFKNFAIGIVALDEKYNTWLVGQYRYTINQYSWEIPEGGGDLKIPPLVSAKRELLEEAGLKAKKWKKIMTLHLSNSISDEVGIVYVAQQLIQDKPCPEDDEQLVIKKLPFQKVYGMVVNGEITDSLAVNAILRVKILIEEGKI